MQRLVRPVWSQLVAQGTPPARHASPRGASAVSCGCGCDALQEAGKAPPASFKVESTPGAAELVLRRSFEGEDIAVIVSSPEEEDDDPLGFGEDDDGAPEDGQEDVCASCLGSCLPLHLLGSSHLLVCVMKGACFQPLHRGVSCPRPCYP